MGKEYYPKKGEIIWCALDPITGHEQAGNRPCVVLSGDFFNHKTGMVVICPMTSIERSDYYFRVSFKSKSITGFIMVDQIRTIDWRKRFVKTSGVIAKETLVAVYEKLEVLFDE